MTIWDSSIVILMGEGLVALLIVVLLLLLKDRYRYNKEMAAIDRFITQLDDESHLKTKQLEHVLQNSGAKGQSLATALQEVGDSERALFQQIFQLYLQRNLNLMSEIDQSIANMSDPYCKLLAATASGSVGDSHQGDAAAKNAGLEKINQQLVKQLDSAMQTIDEMSAEYTRVFSGTQSALELENSYKKMMSIFQDASQQAKAAIQESGAGS